MGIKGIYGQIGRGQRIALSKLAVEHYEKNNRPLRIAVDISIWHFQIQSGKGGSNPALRTLYYRLVRLLALAIQPLFVFDGPNRPPFKRNSRTCSSGASLPNFLTKQLLKHFGFPFHTAPGEAEAECALLQREGIVDAVLSEDVDTLMFGCSLTLRNWSSEGTRGSKSPTHVSVYAAKATKQEYGLDCDGMILIALMSGGDYIPAGVPRCGIKTAFEAAKAGFGHDLCRIPKKDNLGFQQWRERLRHELRLNSSGYFRAKHKTLNIPDTFPDRTVLGYYTDPVVSTAEKVIQLSSSIVWDSNVDIGGLRKFVAEAFEWYHLSGVRKFLRGIAPALLIRQLYQRAQIYSNSTDGPKRQEEEEKKIIMEICGRRCHFVTDATPELRVGYIPNDIVGLDLTIEEDDSLNIEHCSGSESDFAGLREGNDAKSVAKRTTKSTDDPQQPEKIWILETFAKLGVPLLVENWEEGIRNPKISTSRKGRVQVGMKQGALDSFLRVSKVSSRRDIEPESIIPSTSRRQKPSKRLKKASTLTSSAISESPNVSRVVTKRKPSKPEYIEKHDSAPVKTQPPSNPKFKPPIPDVESGRNSLGFSKRPSDTFNVKISAGSRYSALGIYGDSSLGVLDTLSKAPKPSTFASPTVSSSNRTPLTISDDDSFTNPKRNSSIDSNRTREPAIRFGSGDIQAIVSVAEGLSVATPLELSPASSLTSLPSPSTLLSPSIVKKSPGQISSKATIDIPSSPTEARKSRRRLVKLRKSVAGAWRAAESWEAEGAHEIPVYQNVEVLDLT